MYPKVILHNTITVNGLLDAPLVDLDLHYSIANQFNANAFIVGANTILAIDEKIPTETEEDLQKPQIDKNDPRPYWIVVDSKGRLQNCLYHYRKMPYIKDTIVLISEETPIDYINYLKERNYPIVKTGKNYVDFPEAFKILKSEYNISSILCDSGAILGNVLLNIGLIDEISILISPLLMSDSTNRLFNSLELPKEYKLKLTNLKELKDGIVWLNYKIEK